MKEMSEPGKDEEVVYDLSSPEANFQTVLLERENAAWLKQTEGRVGRTQTGVHLLSLIDLGTADSDGVVHEPLYRD